MANPQNPGMVSGPGRLSKRTDLPPKGQPIRKLPNAAYGEQQQFLAQEAAAPMAKANPAASQIIPLGSPTRRPLEPVTAGVDAGPGPGSNILGMKTPVDTQLEDLSMLAQYMPLLESFADSQQSTGTMKSFIKYLRSQTSEGI